MRKPIGVAGAIIGLIVSMSAAQASEVWVQQSRGRISGGTGVAEENKPAAAPEGPATTGSGSPSTPRYLQSGQRLLACLLQRDAAEPGQMICHNE